MAVPFTKDVLRRNNKMAESIQSHINLFGAWDPQFTPEDVFSRKSGTEIIADFVGLVLEIKRESLTLEIVRRFSELSPSEVYIPVIPNEEKFIDRLVRPLKSAKRTYCLGEFLATVALSGLAGESLALLAYRIRKFVLNGQPISGEQEKKLFGKDFDSLGQERRIKVLECLGYIDRDDERLFLDLKGCRDKYLHLWEVDTSQIHSDAKKSFLNAMRLFKKITGLSIDESGSLVMNPNFLAYLKQTQSLA
jgi:hypothetical protein